MVRAYIVNDDLTELRIDLNTLMTLKPERYIYEFKQGILEGDTLAVNIYPTKDKTEAQILALQEKAIPEIFKRYPSTQSVGYRLKDRTISVLNSPDYIGGRFT